MTRAEAIRRAMRETSRLWLRRADDALGRPVTWSGLVCLAVYCAAAWGAWRLLAQAPA